MFAMPLAQPLREVAARDCHGSLDQPNWGDFVQNACLRLTVALFAIYLLFGCGVADDHPAVVMSNGTHTQATPTPSTPSTREHCADEGASRECKVVLPSQGGLTNCFTGVQDCVDGAWSECHDAVK